jgi:hypothetical protein
MAVFLAASDESERGVFLYGGFVAPEPVWSSAFSLAWYERVLHPRDPRLEWLHMVDIRSDEWRNRRGLSHIEGERRVDEALRIINSTNCIHPITSEVNARHFEQAFADIALPRATAWGHGKSRSTPMEPDYLCFLMYAFEVLGFVHREYPDAERVDFIYEKTDKAKASSFHQFHEGMPATLRELGLEHLSKLVGELLPVTKERIPVQAADVLCWHARRIHEGSDITLVDRRRYAVLARLNGRRHQWTGESVTAFAEVAVRAHQ